MSPRKFALSSFRNDAYVEEISEKNPLKVMIAGGGVGGLSLAKALSKNPNMEVLVLERADKFKRFGGPIQLASNALKAISEMDTEIIKKSWTSSRSLVIKKMVSRMVF